MTDNERIKNGLIKYVSIMEKYKSCNISEDKEFQKMFNGFYRIRRNESWRKIFYDYFEEIKNLDKTYDEIVTYIYNETGMVEASFSSKMYATINPDKPIWDRYVLKALNIEMKPYYSNKIDQLNDVIKNYHKIEKWYLNLDDSLVNKFDSEFPEYKSISKVKKNDFMIWGIRKEDDSEFIEENEETKEIILDDYEYINNNISNIIKTINKNQLNDQEKRFLTHQLQGLINILNRK